MSPADNGSGSRPRELSQAAVLSGVLGVVAAYSGADMVLGILGANKTFGNPELLLVTSLAAILVSGATLIWLLALRFRARNRPKGMFLALLGLVLGGGGMAVFVAILLGLLLWEGAKPPFLK